MHETSEQRTFLSRGRTNDWKRFHGDETVAWHSNHFRREAANTRVVETVNIKKCPRRPTLCTVMCQRILAAGLIPIACKEPHFIVTEALQRAPPRDPLLRVRVQLQASVQDRNPN
jgi:hypothetical protein